MLWELNVQAICTRFEAKKITPFWMVFTARDNWPSNKFTDLAEAEKFEEQMAEETNEDVLLIECKSIRTCKATKKVEWSE